MKNITIGSVEMPLSDFVVSRNAILGITKSGKTYTAKGIAEQLLDLKVPIVVFDAIGVWRYLKVPAKHSGAKGYQVVVAGGSHPDLPLTTHSAPEIVRAAIRENIPLIIDLYDAKLSKADWRRIVQESFRILLYENKGLRHVFLEEAAEYAPQKVMDGVTYAEVEKLARMGGNASVGITFINQRAQELNKAVLELCDNIILLRQRGTHAIDSLEKQMDKLDPDTSKEIAASMPHMTQGDCWIFTENDEKPVRTRSGTINSFHPDRRKPDEQQIQKAAVNTDEFVAALSGKLATVIEEAKANDPAELRRTIASLKRELAQRTSETRLVEVQVISPEIERDMRKLSEITASSAKAINEQVDFVGRKLHELICTVKVPPRTQPHSLDAARYSVKSAPKQRDTATSDLTGTMQKIINTVAMLGERGLLPNREMIARWLRIHPNGGRYGSDLAALRAGGYMEGCELTNLGKLSARHAETGVGALLDVLDGTQRNIINLLLDGASFDRESLAAALGIHPNGGRFGSQS